MQSMSVPSNVEFDASKTSQPQLPYTMIPCEVDSVGSPNSSSWLGKVWGSDGSEFWRICRTNNNFNTSNNGGHGRVSTSSLESGSSYEDMNIDYVDDNNNSSNVVDGERFGGLTVATTTTVCGQDDTNNNTTDWNSNNNKQVEDLSNNNDTNDITKGQNRTKNSTPRTRVLDEDGFIRRAACVCVDQAESKVLLVSSKKDPCSWLVPGGGVEVGEEMSTAAMREAWEEAGVQGHITRYLGLFETQHHSGRKRHRTSVYVVQVQDLLAHYPEAHLGRQREWFSVEEALLHLSRHRPLQSAYLQLLLVSRLKVPPT